MIAAQLPLPAEKAWFQTWSGHICHIDQPRPHLITIEDIAHHLSRICRWSGALDSEHFSVAQHSVIVSQHVPIGFELVALLHDASEAYLGDVIRPLKSLLPLYKDLEHGWMAAIAEAFFVPIDALVNQDEVIKVADNSCLATEARDLLLPGPGRDRAMAAAIPFHGIIVPLGPRAAEELFLARFNELTREVP